MKGSFEKKDVKVTAKKIKGFKGFAPMFHSHVEMVYVIKGKIEMCIDGSVRKLSAGEMSITFPYSIHSYEESPETEVVIVMFSPETAEFFKKELISHKPESPYITDANGLLPLFERLIVYSEDNEKMTNAYLNVIVGEVVQSLNLIKTESMDLNSAQQILMYCSEHYKEDISVKKVASALYLSESYVTKIFSGKLGCSFREYINALRISEVKKQLKNTDAKITDIMLACGFNNQSSFNRVFYEEMRCTPREYRESSKAFI